MNFDFYNPDGDEKEKYRMLIRLDDTLFPSHAAYFRAAAQVGALGMVMHTCFAPAGPAGERIAHRPSFITLHHYTSDNNPCVAVPISFPDTDIAYGEYTAPGPDSDATFAPGTVLMYPRKVTLKGSSGEPDTPWFVVFRPCAAALLRGAVPVGRVVACVRCGEEDLLSNATDEGEQPFDATVLISLLMAFSSGEKCVIYDQNKPSKLYFSHFHHTHPSD